MKVIDLLVKIANGEENTEVKTKYDSVNWDKNDFFYSFYMEFGKRNNDRNVDFLNDEIEVIEENKKINFEEIEELTCNSYDFKTLTINQLIKNQKKLIYEVNKLKGEK